MSLSTSPTEPRSSSPWSTQGDDLEDAERERLHAALLEAQEEIDRGQGIPAERVIERLRRRRQ